MPGRSRSRSSWRARRREQAGTTHYQVIHRRVIIRAEPSTSAAPLSSKSEAEVVPVEAVVSGWARLSERFDGQPGWMLIDGTSLGLGELLRRLPSVPPPPPHTLAVSGDRVTLRGGVSMPLLGMGTGGVPGLEGEECSRLVCHALRHCGVRLLDTAAHYHNEEALGEGIRRSGVPRRELFVLTKVAPLEQGFEAATRSVHRSLQRMQLEYVDLLLVHWPGGWVSEQREWPASRWVKEGPTLARSLRGGTWKALEALLAQGLTRAIGVSNYTVGHLAELLRECSVPPAVCQSEHHPFWPNTEVRRFCAANGIAFQAYGPLSGGAAERAAKLRGPDNATVRQVAQRVGRSPAQVMLRWATQRGVSVLPKSHSPERIEENANASGFDLSGEELAALDGLDTGKPSYWDPQCVDQLDTFNCFMDKERLQLEFGT